MIPREGGTDEAPHVGPNDYRLFRKAVEAVEENYANPALDVSAIARHCAVSRSLLDRVFHETLSHGPKEFLQRYRVDRSKQLMRARTHSLSEIALLTGFPDIFAFSRTFKRLTGKPPSRHAKDNAG